MDIVIEIKRIMAILNRVTVTGKRKLSDKVYLISFKREVDFTPGQIIGLTNDQKLEPRLYSICSSAQAQDISILFIVKDSGRLTPTLADSNVGDPLWMTPVQGQFVYKDEPAWWIATGTGIAPFYSMYVSGQTPDKLLQGGRRQADFYFEEEFNPLNDYVKCSSQEERDGCYSGRLTQYIIDYPHLPTDINYYLCGSAEMVVDVRNRLISRGVSFEHIITEIYF